MIESVFVSFSAISLLISWWGSYYFSFFNIAQAYHGGLTCFFQLDVFYLSTTIYDFYHHPHTVYSAVRCESHILFLFLILTGTRCHG